MDCEEAREAHKCWDAQAVTVPGFGYGLSGSGWRRVLALWGLVGVPFFWAFRAP